MTEVTARLSTALADRYAFQRHVGEGGMATVYLAHDLKHDRNVAVKVLRPELAAIVGGERFLNEIKVTANLQHPNILPLYDSGEADGFLYYVMPFMEGETLRDKMNREKQMSVEETVEISRDVAAALHFAHERGIVHRDIKPENILLQDGKPLVADFGIALAVSQASSARLTETGLSLGTPHYMSPEQATGDRELDARSDVYSLGAMAYEMLVGEPPHTGTTVQAIIARILSEDPESVTKHRHSVPVHVDAAIRKALDRTPADRFATAAKFAEALSNTSFTLPSTTAATAAAAAVSPKRRSVTLGLLAVALVSTTLAIFGWFRPIDKPVSRYHIALPAEEALAAVNPPRLAIADDGSMYAYTGISNSGSQIWLRRRDELHATALPGTEGMVRPFFSPDGTHIGFSGADLTIYVLALGGGAPLTVIDSGIGNEGADWGEDGFIYYDGLTGGGDIGLKRIPAFGGRVAQLTTVDTAAGETDHTFPEVLPNGKGVIFRVERGAAPSDIAVLDLASREYSVLVRGTHARYAASGHLFYTTDEGALVALPFDQDAMEIVGDPVSLATEVRVGGASIDAGADLAVSHEGTMIYATGEALVAPHELVWVDRDGVAEVLDPRWEGQFNSLALSPDDSRLAVGIVEAGELQTWIKQLDRGPLTKLTFEGSQSYRPAWSPDGRSVMFVSNRAGGFDLYSKPADGSSSARLILDETGEVLQPIPSQDGAWLAYRVNEDGGDRNLYARRLDGDSTRIPLVATGFQERAAALSPDGRLIAYVSNESGRDEIYVRPFPNADDARWQASVTGGREPAWSHSGRELFFVSRGNNFISLPVLPSSTFAAGEPRTLFSVVGYRRDTQHP
ncbi:MAG: protein kinase, partial [Gemmatimonadales bacterium]